MRFSPEWNLRPRLDRIPAAFRYLKEFRKQKSHKQKLEGEDGAREEMHIEMDRVIQEDAERSARETEIATREITSGGAMAAKRTSAPRRTPADGIDDEIPYVKNANAELVPYVPPPPRRFSEEDRKRANRNRDRYTRASWGKRLRAIAEGRVTVTKAQLQAHLAYGRFRGGNRRPVRPEIALVSESRHALIDCDSTVTLGPENP